MAENKYNKQFKVLVVDDNVTNIQVVGNILKQANFAVGFAMNGQQALDILYKTPDFDLVLLDIDMPILNGFDTIKIIRLDERLKDIPVIFLTAHHDSEKIVEGFDLGAQDYLTKPFNTKELMARVHTHLQLKYTSDELKHMYSALESKNNNITNSINYANYIQHAMLPNVALLNDMFSDYFIINKPKDNISGDFYWFQKIGHCFYIAAADCTGHGVPGAMMSMLGLSRLNYILNNQIKAPNVILNELRSFIKESLHSIDNDIASYNGIDISLCLINTETKTLEFSGAYNSLLYFKKEGAQTELIEIEADRMPVGAHPKDNMDFTNHELDLTNIHSFYIASDGYYSQLGGEKTKVFTKKRYRNLLFEHHEKTMSDQHQVIEQQFSEWQGEEEQTDDVLLMGMKLK